MTGRAVPAGALYCASSRRRRTVAIDPPLRETVAQAVQDVRRMLASATTDARRCPACSLRERCQPAALARLARLAAESAADLFSPAEPEA